jgi:hypothetical protein
LLPYATHLTISAKVRNDYTFRYFRELNMIGSCDSSQKKKVYLGAHLQPQF